MLAPPYLPCPFRKPYSETDLHYSLFSRLNSLFLCKNSLFR